jgi:porphobilinogen synthase
MRRLRTSDQLRSLVRETRLSPQNFIYPMFVCPGKGVRREIRSMPGVFNLSVDQAVEEAREVKALGIPGVILFGLPDKKDNIATGAWIDDGVVQRAAHAIRQDTPDLLLIGDVCLCEYMSHGHCGVVRSEGPRESSASWSGVYGSRRFEVRIGTARDRVAQAVEEHAAASASATEPSYQIDNDATLEILARTAVSLVRAGIDIVAPSDMMDGRVAAIRKALDDAGYLNAPILSYAAKFASAFYGPFREAADSAPQFGDRRSYQMDGANAREAMREIELDIAEGADIVMIKPALPYLDVIAEARRRFDVPLAAYQVSGEYAMIKAAAQNNWLDHDRVVLESLVAIRRAGASIILTYFAKDAARLLA